MQSITRTMSRRVLFFVFLWLTVVCTPAFAALDAGQTIDDAFAPLQKRTYEVHVAAGQYAELTLAANEPATMRVRCPGSDELSAIPDPDTTRLLLPLLPDADGSCSVDVQRTSRDGAPETFHLTLSPPRGATPQDRLRVAAVREFVAADAVQGNEAKDQWTRIAHYTKALAFWQQLGNAPQEASTLRRTGVAYVRLQDADNALCYLESAESMAIALRLPRIEAATEIAIAALYANKGDKARAVDHYRWALAAYRKLHQSLGEARALVGIGLHDTATDPEEALEQMRRAVVLYHEAGDDAGEMYVLNVLASKYGIHDDEKIDALQRSLAIARARNDRDGQAYALNTLATSRMNQGNLRAALDLCLEANALFKAAGDVLGQASSLWILGAIYRTSGDPEAALQRWREALALYRSLHDRGGEAMVQSRIGAAQSAMGDTSLASAALHESLSLFRELGDREGEARALRGLGDNDVAAHRWQSALTNYRAALAINDALRKNIARAENLLGIADVEIEQQQPAAAVETIRSAYGMADSTTAEFIEYELARAERALGHPDAALRHARAAVEATEAVTARVPGVDLRTSYVAVHRHRHELLVELLMRKRLRAEALEASERARARGLLDLLNEARADVRSGVEPALLERERALQATLSFKSAYRLQLLSREHSAREAADVERAINNVMADYEEVERQIRGRSPHYAALTQPQPLRVSDMRALLDRDTALLSLFLGDDASFGWLLTRTSLHAFRLPPRAKLEAVARRAYAELSVNDPQAARPAVAELGRTLLSPIASSLGVKRLVVVADGALAYIPFAALPLPSGSLLITQHEIVHLPSASALATLRQETRTRSEAPKVVAVFADPVFRADDPRVSGATRRATAPDDAANDVERSARQSGVMTFDRLPATRSEADTIVALGGRKQSLEALDFGASREAALSPALADYRIVHFASHMLLNSRHPELSGIVLSLVDAKGEPQNGFLQVHEIFNLKLHADLVVLSGCQTALGKDVRGEGLVGPVRAFMYAGAQRVVASLWKVPDRATAKLMQELYAGMLDQHLTPAAALQRAQLELRRDPLYSSPYHWAGFVLQGEWK